MRIRWLALVLILAGCHVSASGGDGGSADKPDAAKCASITILKDAMQCEIAPYMSGKGDEEAFRKALAQVRELGPSDPRFMSGPNAWPLIVDGMLQTRQYKQGCKQCHQAYLKPYRAEYESVQIPWQPTHAVAAR